MKIKLGALLVALTGILALGACSETCEIVEDAPIEEDNEGSSDTNEDDNKTYYAITFEGNDFVYAIDLPEKAEEGEEISFTLLVESGYQASNVSVTYKGTEWVEVEEEEENPLGEDGFDFYDEEGDNEDPDPDDEEKEPVYEEVECDIELELTHPSLDEYSFVMPDKDVTVHAEGLGATFKLFYDPDEIVFTNYNGNSQKASSYWGNVYEPVTGELLSSGVDNYIQAGREVMVVGLRTYTEQNLKLYANGEPLEEITDSDVNAGYLAFALTMPYENCKITMSVEEKYMNVVLDTTSLVGTNGNEIVDEEGNGIVDAYLYTDDDSTPVQNVENQKIESDKPYIHAVIKDGYTEDWSLEAVNISWNAYNSASSLASSENSKETAWSDTTTSTKTDGTATKVDENTKKFQIPSAYFSDDTITVTFVLRDLTAYKDYDFLGSWSGYECYNGSRNGSQRTFTIDGSGLWTSDYSSLNGKQIVSVEEDTLNCTIDDGRTFYNDGKVGIMLYTSSTKTSSDTWVFVKATASDTITWDIYKESSYIYVIRLLVNNEYVGAVFANGVSSSSGGVSDQHFYAGVTITFNGETTTVAEGNFTVTDSSGNTLKAVDA